VKCATFFSIMNVRISAIMSIASALTKLGILTRDKIIKSSDKKLKIMVYISKNYIIFYNNNKLLI